MLEHLMDDFAVSQHCARAWCDHIWDRRLEEQNAANRVRAADYESRRALRSEADECPKMRAKPAIAYGRRRVTAAEVIRALGAAR